MTVDAGGAASPRSDFLIGDRTLVVGDGAGGVVDLAGRPAADGRRPRASTRIHDFERHARPVVGDRASQRDKGFVTADAAGRGPRPLRDLGQTLLSLRPPARRLRAVVFAPKADGVVVVDGDGRIVALARRQPAPRGHARHALRQGLVRGLRGAGVRLAVDRRHRRLRAQAQPDAAALRHAQGHVLLAAFAVPLALLAAHVRREFMHPRSSAT